MLRVLGLVLAAVTVACGAAPGAGADGGVVRTDLGPVRGTVQGEVRDFQGIPYAAPPEGELRWRSPRPAAPWQGVRDATGPGDICPQAPARQGRQSEDCLNLRVTTATTPERPRPVLVLLDAGALKVSSNVTSDPRRMVTEGDVVLVQPNERMNLFGFFAHPAMDEPAAGSFGIEDQQAALRWVQRNIAAFGGDPNNVTLAGISGGGVSTCANVMSPGAAGLFHRAIIQSGACDGQVASFIPGDTTLDLVRPLEQAQADGERLAADLGCAEAGDVMSCLRSKPLPELAEHVDRFGATVYGNAVLPLPPATALQTGRFNRMPVLTGTTRDEVTFYTNLVYPEGTDLATYRSLIDDGTGTADAILAEYPPERFGGSAAAAMTAAMTDRFFVLRGRQHQEAMARHVPVFSYEFADRDAPRSGQSLGVPLPPQEESSIDYGAFHGSDIPYLYDTTDYQAPFTAEQSTLSDQMLRYWSAFVHHGTPEVDGQPAWPAFRAADPVPHVHRLTTMGQGGVGPAPDFAAEHHYEFWSRLHPPRE